MTLCFNTGHKSPPVGDNVLISHSPADGVSVVSNADLECLSEHANDSPRDSQLSDHQDAGDSREVCHTARSTLLR